ncbi:MAG: phosphopentomutase [Ignavibacteriales bacterium]|nr:phosphopentomutase [Ignavibacteriales bacterium]
MNNFLLIILDGVGIGEAPDAEKFNDSGSNTLGNISKKVGGLKLPNLQKFGLANIENLFNFDPVTNPDASYGKMMEVSSGKDSTTGHWEIGGVVVDFEFPTYPNGFPEELMQKFISENKLSGYLANKPASGTEIIQEYGNEHLLSGKPIVYTSADSVFQIAAHEDIIPIDQLYKICEITRNKICINEHAVGRIIARPFIGTKGNYTRTTNRKDFSINPPKDTILDLLYKKNINTVAIGKVNDLFNYRGINKEVKSKSNLEGIEKILQSLKSEKNSFIFVNLVDFDVYYGHRNDPEGFHNALIQFDNYLPQILEALDSTDRLVITADHGNDPTTPSTDHSREYVPLLYFSKEDTSKNLGTRKTFADVAKTVADFYQIENKFNGKSFLN